MMEMIVSLPIMISVPLAIVFIGIIIFKAPSKFNKFIYIYFFIFFMLGYAYNPTYENDLYRYFAMLQNCSRLPFSQAFSWTNDGLFIKNLLFWLIAHTGDFHLLPALSTGLLYGISAYIAADSMKENSKRLYVIIFFQLMIFPFLEIVCNVRNVLSFSLIILAAYRDIVQKKRGSVTILLYIVPCFIHMSGFALVLLRFGLLFLRRKPIIGLITMMGIPSLAIYVYENFYSLIVSLIPGDLGLVIQRGIFKAYTSSTNTSEYAISMSESGYFNSCRVVIFLAFSILLYFTIRYFKMKNNKFGERSKIDFAMFNILISGVTVIWILNGTVKYWVFAVAGVIASGPIIAYYLLNYDLCTFKDKICLNGLIMVSFLRFILEIYYISSRIYLLDFIMNILVNNAFFIIGRLIYNMIL